MGISLSQALYALAFALGIIAGWYPTHAFYALKIAHQDSRNQQAAITAQKNDADKEHHDQLLTEDNSHALQNRLSDIDRQFDADIARLQQTAAPDNLPGVADSKPGHYGACPAAELSRPDKQLLVTLAKQADEQTARLVACQDWIRQHGMAQ